MRVPADTPLLKRVLLASTLGLIVVVGGASAAQAAGLAPTPTQLRVTGATTSSVSLQWNGNLLASSHGVYRGASLVGSTQGTSYTVTGLACGTSYVFGVDSVDVLGGRIKQTEGKAIACAAGQLCRGRDRRRRRGGGIAVLIEQLR